MPTAPGVLQFTKERPKTSARYYRLQWTRWFSQLTITSLKRMTQCFSHDYKIPLKVLNFFRKMFHHTCLAGSCMSLLITKEGYKFKFPLTIQLYVVCTFPLSAGVVVGGGAGGGVGEGGREVEPLINFSKKGGLDRISIFRGGCWERWG